MIGKYHMIRIDQHMDWKSYIQTDRHVQQHERHVQHEGHVQQHEGQRKCIYTWRMIRHSKGQTDTQNLR